MVNPHDPRVRNTLDKALGLRIRTLREKRGLSQGTLGDMIGLTYQQVQKYENGTNRVGFSRLIQIAAALNTKVEYFYEEVDGTVDTILKINDPSVVRLFTAYNRIKDDSLRRSFVTVAELIVKNQSSTEKK